MSEKRDATCIILIIVVVLVIVGFGSFALMGPGMMGVGEWARG